MDPARVLRRLAGPQLEREGYTIIRGPVDADQVAELSREVSEIFEWDPPDYGRRLAEMQLKVVWEEILTRFKRIEVVAPPRRLTSALVKGYETLPVRILG